MTSPNQPAPDGARSYEQVAELRTVKVPGNIDQGLYDQAEAMRGSFLGNILSGFGSIGQAIGSLLDDLVSAFFGRYTGSNPKLIAFQDGQLALNERLELLDEVSGFAVAYCGENYMQGGGSKFYTVRFNKRIGPQKNATVNGDGTITLAKGTWSINCLVTVDTNIGNPTGFLRVEVLYPPGDPRINSSNGGVYSMKEVQQNIEGGKWSSYQCFHPVVADKPGFKVRARFRYAPAQLRKTLIRGGTYLSHLSVDRKDLSAEKAVVDEDVPTGPEND